MDAFVTGPLETAREPDEILVAIVVPAAARGEGRAYEKAKFRERPAVSVGVRVRVADGRVAESHVAVGSLTDVPVLVPEAAGALVGSPVVGGDRERPGALDDALRTARQAFGHLDAVADLDGSADFKRHLAGVMLGRATRAAIAEATSRA
jgi:carbon-monoxide dehydrogenase medium subunit